eukprot:gene23718-32098_t
MDTKCYCSSPKCISDHCTSSIITTTQQQQQQQQLASQWEAHIQQRPLDNKQQIEPAIKSGSSLKFDNNCIAEECAFESELLQHTLSNQHHRTANTITLSTIIDAAIATHQQLEFSTTRHSVFKSCGTASAHRAESTRRMTSSQHSTVKDICGPSIISIAETTQPPWSSTWANKLFSMQSGIVDGGSPPCIIDSSKNQSDNATKSASIMLPGAHHACPICKKVFLSQSDLDSHRRNKHVEKKVSETVIKPQNSIGSLHKCSISSKKFDHEQKLLSHVKSKHEKETAEQSKANKPPIISAKVAAVPQKKIVQSHLTKPGVKDHHSCSLCAKVFLSQSDLNRHTLSDHSPQPGKLPKQSRTKTTSESNSKLYKCSTCAEEFNTEQKLKRHEEKKHREKPFCFICSKEFKNLEALSQHDLAKHSIAADASGLTSIDLEEDDCGMPVITTKQAWRTHPRKEFDSLTSFDSNSNTDGTTCDHSSQPGHLPKRSRRSRTKTNSENDSNEPLKTEMKGELYKCCTCAEEFNTEQKLKRHEEKKHGEKPFCFICSKEFKHVEALSQHDLAKHSIAADARESTSIVLKEDDCGTPVISNYECSLCSKMFLSPSILDHHKHSKHGEDIAKQSSTALPLSTVKATQPLQHSVSMPPVGLAHGPSVDNASDLTGTNAVSPRQFQRPQLEEPWIATAVVPWKSVSDYQPLSFVDLLHKCSICSKEFDHEQKLLSHVKSKHEKETVEQSKAKPPIITVTFAATPRKEIVQSSDLNNHTLSDHSSPSGHLPNPRNNSIQLSKTEMKGGLYKRSTYAEEFNAEEDVQIHGENAVCSKVLESVQVRSQHDLLLKNSMAAYYRELIFIDHKFGIENGDGVLPVPSRYECLQCSKMFLSSSFLDQHHQIKHAERQQKNIPDKNSIALSLSTTVVDMETATATEVPLQHSASMPPEDLANPSKHDVSGSAGTDTVSPRQANLEVEILLPQLEEPWIIKAELPLKSLSDMLAAKLNSLQITSNNHSASVVPISHDQYGIDSLLQSPNGENEDDDSSMVSTEYYACQLCTKVFLSTVDLDRHQKSKHNENQTPISIGSLEQNLKTHLLKDHSNAHTSESMHIYGDHSPVSNEPATVLKTDNSDNDSSTISAINEAPNSIYHCSFCSKKFDLNKRLYCHMIKRHAQKAICIICGITFKNNKSLQQHWDCKHNGSQKCSICKKELRHNLASQKYVDYQHVEQAYCPICAKEVENISAHMNVQHSSMEYKQSALSAAKNAKIIFICNSTGIRSIVVGQTIVPHVEVYNRRSISQGIGTLTVTVTVTGDAIIERIVTSTEADQNKVVVLFVRVLLHETSQGVDRPGTGIHRGGNQDKSSPTRPDATHAEEVIDRQLLTLKVYGIASCRRKVGKRIRNDVTPLTRTGCSPPSPTLNIRSLNRVQSEMLQAALY